MAAVAPHDHFLRLLTRAGLLATLTVAVVRALGSGILC